MLLFGTAFDAHGLFAASFVALQVPLKLFVLVGQHELVGQVIFVEVVDKIPETLLVLLFRTEQVEVDLEVPFVV